MSLDASVGAEAVRHELETVERLLAQHGESGPAQMSRAALDGTDQKLCACLASTLFPGREGFAESLSTQLLIPQMLVADSGALP